MLDNKEMMHRLAEVLGDLAEKAIKRILPFDRVPLQREIHGWLTIKYFQYYSEIDEKLRDRFMKSLVIVAKEGIQRQLRIYEKIPFEKRHPDLANVQKEFYDWVVKREGIQKDRIEIRGGTIKIKELIKQIMKEREPEFATTKSRSTAEIIFSKQWLGDNQLFIMIDWGAKRQALTFDLGIKWPEFNIDIAELFGGGQSFYSFDSSEDLIAGMHKGLDVVDIILPHFVQAVESVVKK